MPDDRIIGVSGFFDPIGAASAFTRVPSSVFVLFQMMLCATSAIIVSGAMAERTKFCLLSHMFRSNEHDHISGDRSLDMGRLAQRNGIS